jgi:hypothetical protein
MSGAFFDSWQAVGAEHPGYAVHLNTLAGVTAAQERKEDVMGFWRPALDRLKVRPPPDHPHIGAGRGHLDNLLIAPR